LSITCKLTAHAGSDHDIVAAAKVIETLNGIVNFMMREKHGTPFEHAFLKFIVEAPIMVSREHFRHRTGHSFNEISTRYTDIRKAGEPYVVQGESQHGKTGAYEFRPLPMETLIRGSEIIDRVHEAADEAYDELIELGYGKQDAGTVLTISHPTRYVWSCNPRSLMHFLALRNAPQARREIRMVAQQAEAQFAELFPVTHAAFEQHGRVAP
jgi:thymidylate synthase (FAD)